MKHKKVKYTDEPIDARIVDDFLPSPDKLVLKEDHIKVTLTLSKRSIEFFKHYANEQDVGYQAMIRSLLDQYTDRFSKHS